MKLENSFSKTEKHSYENETESKIETKNCCATFEWVISHPRQRAFEKTNAEAHKMESDRPKETKRNGDAALEKANRPSVSDHIEIESVSAAFEREKASPDYDYRKYVPQTWLALGDKVVVEFKPRDEKSTVLLAESQAPLDKKVETGTATKEEKTAYERDIDAKKTDYRDDEGNLLRPKENGAIPNSEFCITICPCSIVDRYGSENGKYFAPEGTAPEKRSLPSSEKEREHNVYFVSDRVDAKVSVVAPFYRQNGGGLQFQTEKTIAELKEEGRFKLLNKR